MRSKAITYPLVFLLTLFALITVLPRISLAHSSMAEYDSNGNMTRLYCGGSAHDGLCHGTGGGGGFPTFPTLPPTTYSCNITTTYDPTWQPNSSSPTTSSVEASTFILSSSGEEPDYVYSGSNTRATLRVYMTYRGGNFNQLNSSWSKHSQTESATYFLSQQWGQQVELKHFMRISPDAWESKYHIVEPQQFVLGDTGPLVSGGYNLTYVITSGSSGTQLCASTRAFNIAVPPPVSRQPYFRVFGGDTSAGVGFGESCSPNAGAGIRGFTNADGGGAGTQIAAFAAGAIDQFTSAQRSGNPTQPKGLSFSNTSGTYGGNFSGTCVPDYYSFRPSQVDVNLSSGSLSSLSGAGESGDYRSYGYTQTASGSPLNINLPGRVSGRNVVYVDGDVVINSNVLYQDGQWNVDTSPSLWLVVRGNIYIKPGVTNIEGVFIAQPKTDGSKGRIFTCTNSAGNGPPSTATEWSACGY